MQRRAFFRRTRKGKVIRIVNDKYLRDDSVGVPRELLVLDTNVALQEIDVLEYKSPATACVVVPQTVLQELRHLNVSVFHRLKALLSNEDLTYVFFPNEVCKSTAVSRGHGESINDANDRAIRVCARHINNLISPHGATALLLSMDKAMQTKANEEGLECKTMHSHINRYLTVYPELGDLLSSSATVGRETSLQTTYPAHLSPEAISSGLRSGKLLRASLRCSERRPGVDNWTRCYAVVHTKSKKRVFYDVHGHWRVNRAVDGDVVVLEDANIVEETLEASSEAIEGVLTAETAARSYVHVDGSSTDSKSYTTVQARSYGRVVGIIRRNWKKYAGSLHKDSAVTVETAADMNMSACLFQAVDARLPVVRITTRRRVELESKRILVAIDSWPVDSAFPLGHYTKVLLHDFDVPHAEFSSEVMACLPASTWKITEEIIKQRTDLRHIPVVSIDPPADVTHFVHPDTPLDKEAAHRSTSTYLLCSLRSEEDHLAFSVMWEFDDDGNIIDVTFCKSVIHSVASLTYAEAQAMLDCPSDDPNSVSMSVQLLNKIARILRQRRIDMGALTLASPEVRFTLDAETQNPTDVKKVLRHYPTLGVLRRHEPPSREQFAPLMEAAQAAGVSIDITSSKALADSLDAAVNPNDAYFNKLLRIMSTRCMMPAQYFCSGEFPKELWHHYGLAAPVYTHFTSPIRRYADVIVHRLLAAAIGVIPLPVSNADRHRQQELCAHMNRRHN
eukprot:GSChrysophyteH1.ASY1.ANO1.508.1 assembled CDS